jgi:peptidoglycan lytic transglycosylase B
MPSHLWGMMVRLIGALAFATILVVCAHAQPAPDREQRLDAFLRALWPDAAVRGITRTTFDASLAGLAFGTYVNQMASSARIEGGARRAAEWSRTLDAVEQQYGVDRWIIVALWGIETSFGANTGGFDVIRSLATLALSDYRPAYFRDELIAALQILQDGHVARDRMQGSWAGAMGHPQFMPSNFLTLAVDFDGNGRKDIWTSVPDVLASIANYLRHWGWKRGSDWSYEVIVPMGFDYRRSRAAFSQWSELGLTRADGKPLPDAGDAILLFPSGAAGPAFLVGENFSVIKRYNNSDAFALAVGHLADRMRGAGPIRAPWPKDDRQLSRSERIALQRRLAELGHAVNDFEGRIDFDLRDAIRKEQAKHGAVPDGHPTPALLRQIGAP